MAMEKNTKDAGTEKFNASSLFSPKLFKPLDMR